MKQIDNLEAMVRNAWEAGFSLAVNYGDNYIHCQGYQRERQWKAYWNAARRLATPSGAVVEAGISDRELKERAPKTNLNVSESEFIEKFNQLSDRYNAALSSPSVEPTVEEQVEEIMGVIVEEVFEYWNDKATLRQRLIKHLTK